MMNNIEELWHRINRVKQLLDDPQPGLSTWQAAITLEMNELVVFWRKL